MTEQERAVIERLKSKLVALFEVLDKLKSRVVELESDNQQLQSQLVHIKEEYSKVSQKYETSKVALAMTSSDGNKEAKAKIDKILKEIDRCINMLNT
ncbi:MAG: hypothetical protein ACK5MG_08780 [Bacteroidales bacterium]